MSDHDKNWEWSDLDKDEVANTNAKQEWTKNAIDWTWNIKQEIVVSDYENQTLVVDWTNEYVDLNEYKSLDNFEDEK